MLKNVPNCVMTFLLTEEICAHMCDILFLRRGFVEIVQYFKSLSKSGVPDGLCPDTTTKSMENIGDIKQQFIV